MTAINIITFILHGKNQTNSSGKEFCKRLINYTVHILTISKAHAQPKHHMNLLMIGICCIKLANHKAAASGVQTVLTINVYEMNLTSDNVC